MMINNKGVSDRITSYLLAYIVFFIVIYLIVTIGGAGSFITADTILEPPTPEAPAGDWWTAIVDTVSYSIANLEYFFNLLAYSPQFGVFTGLMTIPFLIIIVMYIIEVVRGN